MLHNDLAFAVFARFLLGIPFLVIESASVSAQSRFYIIDRYNSDQIERHTVRYYGMVVFSKTYCSCEIKLNQPNNYIKHVHHACILHRYQLYLPTLHPRNDVNVRLNDD